MMDGKDNELHILDVGHKEKTKFFGYPKERVLAMVGYILFFAPIAAMFLYIFITEPKMGIVIAGLGSAALGARLLSKYT